MPHSNRDKKETQSINATQRKGYREMCPDLCYLAEASMDMDLNDVFRPTDIHAVQVNQNSIITFKIKMSATVCQRKY
jgi:hypothetical protein